MLRCVHHPEVWRYRAALTRVTAEHGADVQARPHELRMAALYERFARYAEERVACDRAQRRLAAPSRVGLIAAPRSDAKPSHIRLASLQFRAAQLERRVTPAALVQPAVLVEVEFRDTT